MKFVIVAFWRTGSTHLVHLLNSHGGILCHGELFAHKETRVSVQWDKEDKRREAAALSELRKNDPKAFLATVYERDYGRTSVGFKIFPGHNDEMLDFLLSDTSVKKVVLFRRNALAVYSSLMIARETKSHKQRSRDPVADTPLVHFRAKHFMRHCTEYLSHYRRVFERLNATRQSFHLINYDQINDPWHFARLVVFLGEEVPPEQLRTKLLKQNPPDILSRFSNSGDVAEFLTKYNLTDWRYESETSLDPFGKLATNETETNIGESAASGELCIGGQPDASSPEELPDMFDEPDGEVRI